MNQRRANNNRTPKNTRAAPKIRSSHADQRDERKDWMPCCTKYAYDESTTESTAMVVNTRITSCIGTERCGSTNCGSKAETKSNAFGFVSWMSKPCRKRLRYAGKGIAGCAAF